MLNKNLLRFLQFRDEIIDVGIYEEKYNLNLPPIYRSFISVFKPYFAHQKVKTGDDERFQSFIVPFYSSCKQESYNIDDDELAFESFKDIEELFKFERSNEGYLKDLLFIANHGYSGGLLVGIGKDNKDQIFHNTDSTVITFMANNIFELIHKIELVECDFDTPPINTSSLYKNWGEEFWRIKK